MSVKSTIPVLIFAFAMLISIVSIPLTPVRAEQNINVRSITYNADPVKFHEVTEVEDESADPIPWNVDMVDAETTSNEGEGIYVAILDTGLLSNYLEFFPEGTVDIKEEWGIGFTHDVWYDAAGEGNWSIEYIDSVEYKFSYGPVRSDRGFITHDDGAPDMYGFGWGSGHGTHVTSIVTGYHFWRGTVDTWIGGVAPKVTIIPVLVLDDWIRFAPDWNGWMWTGGTWEMIAAGIRYIGDLAEAQGVKIIINMSLGGGSPSAMIEEAIDYAISKGVIVVASAGNEGYQGMGWPGAYPQVISAASAGWTQEYGGGYYDYYWWWNDVPEKLNSANYVYDPYTGITYKNNWHTYLSDFSSRPNSTLGQSLQDLDVSAPGAAIRGPYKPYGSTQWGFYAVWGTSQAAPHVSATAALVLESYPNLHQFQLEFILKSAARGNPLPADGAYVSDTFSNFAVWYYWWLDHDAGSGFLTIDEAMRSALVFMRRGARGSGSCYLR
jgi:subtilisin family serine protease